MVHVSSCKVNTQPIWDVFLIINIYLLLKTFYLICILDPSRIFAQSRINKNTASVKYIVLSQGNEYRSWRAMLCKRLVWPHLECCVQIRLLCYRKDGLWWMQCSPHLGFLSIKVGCRLQIWNFWRHQSWTTWRGTPSSSSAIHSYWSISVIWHLLNYARHAIILADLSHYKAALHLQGQVVQR